MVDDAFGDFFLSDVDDELMDDDDEVIAAPVSVPVAAPAQTAPPAAPVTDAAPAVPAITPAVASPALTPVVAPAAVPAATPASTREERLVAALNALMHDSQDIQASALVSLDGFTMASALPDTMQEDRVGAMSAAILGLGERAAVELGRGSLSQVIIEGEGGYVMLIAAGDRAALTCLADTDAKLGLVLYDMRTAALSIAEILG